MINVVNDVLVSSGLSARQVGRLLGCSERTVHAAAHGITVLPEHQLLRAERLRDIIIPLAGSPEERRATLLRSNQGRSLFHRLVDEMPKSAVIQVNSLSAAEQLGC
jgi:hypothetical protein